ncbi:MAG TPA: transcription-repair coupling factor, partial [Planctomycetaceae bacterium]|nr:transcription-repair coupling factor [Planctomycetaceae bacterium]
SRPMDRLLCGDVGYGKTEVAMRAAFQAIDGGRQVAVLVPTTVLAEQHFRTFSERMAEFPVTIESLSRFKTRRQQLETLARLSEGTVDVVIGTHRLVQKDIEFA